MISMLGNPVLPEEIIHEILLRVPAAESLVQCKLVCRTWKTLIDDPIFVDNYFLETDRRHSTIGFLLSRRYDDERRLRPSFYVGEYNDHETDFKASKPAIRHPHSLYRPAIVGSCNGLVCLSAERCSKLDMTVANPLTGECVKIPTRCVSRLSSEGRHYPLDGKVACGFGYHPCTKEYKIITVFNNNATMYVFVYTLGSGRWRENVSDPGVFLWRTEMPMGMLCDGALYWMTSHKKRVIISFDLATEEFRALPSTVTPMSELLRLQWYDSCKLGVLEGCLSLKIPSEQDPERQDIWIKKEKNNEWTKKFNLPSKAASLSSSRNAPRKLDSINPFAVSGSGKLLSVQKSTTRGDDQLVFYDTKTAEFKCLETFFGPIDAIPYSKSLVSLKAIGEEGTVPAKSLSRSKKKMRVRL